MTQRHDYTGTLRTLCTELDLTKPPELRTSVPVDMGMRVDVGGRVGTIAGATAPHEADAPGLVFVRFADAPHDEAPTEFRPGELGLRWL